MFNPICVTCMYNRPAVSELFLEGMNRLGVPVISAVSDRVSMDVCENRAESFLFWNEPLGAKWNAVIEKALDYDYWTHLLISGDDDLYSKEFIERCDEFQDHPYVGIGSLYMISPKDRVALHFRYNYDTPIAVGSGRMLQRSVVEKMVSHGGIYSNDIRNGLDYDGDMRMFELGYRPVLIDDDKTLMVDVKTRQNVWPLSNFTDIAPRCDYDEAILFLSEKERGMIECIADMQRG